MTGSPSGALDPSFHDTHMAVLGILSQLVHGEDYAPDSPRGRALLAFYEKHAPLVETASGGDFQMMLQEMSRNGDIEIFMGDRPKRPNIREWADKLKKYLSEISGSETWLQSLAVNDDFIFVMTKRSIKPVVEEWGGYKVKWQVIGGVEPA